MSKFKVGDEIKCIDAINTINMTEGKVYTVTKIRSTGHPYVINDIGNEDWWHSGRFELVSEYLTPEQVLQYFKEGRQDELEYFNPLRSAWKPYNDMGVYMISNLFDSQWRIKEIPKTIDYYGTELPKPITKAEAIELGLDVVYKLTIGLGVKQVICVTNLETNGYDNLYFKSKEDALVVREAMLKPFKQ